MISRFDDDAIYLQLINGWMGIPARGKGCRDAHPSKIYVEVCVYLPFAL
jgi:hypothetical protein